MWTDVRKPQGIVQYPRVNKSGMVTFPRSEEARFRKDNQSLEETKSCERATLRREVT